MQKISSNLSQKQPPELYLISIAYIGERFGFYMVRALLVLYMVQILLFPSAQAYRIFASFSAMLYLTPLIGGYLTDHFIGSKYAVYLGGLLLTLGYLLLAIPGDQYFYIALAIAIVGKGLFAPNITRLLGQMYTEDDPRREGGFSIFYSSMNLAAVIPPLISAVIIYQFGWYSAFVVAGFSTFLGTLLFYFVSQYRNDIKKISDITTSGYKKIVDIVFVIVGIFIFIGLIHNTFIANVALFSFGSFAILYVVSKAYSFDQKTRSRIFTCVALTAFSIIFFILSQQAAMSLTIYTEYNVNRHFMGWEIPTTFFQSLNPLFIIIFGPLLSLVWLKLDKKNINPSVTGKFVAGTVMTGLGFIILAFAIHFLQFTTGKINFFWLILSYFLQSIGELCIYPIGLAMITKVSPRNMIGLMVGIWYFATAIGTALAGFISTLTVSPASGIINPWQTSFFYEKVFGSIGLFAIISAAVIFSGIFYKKIKFRNKIIN